VKFTLSINCDGDAFAGESLTSEVARLLQTTAHHLVNGLHSADLSDTDGNVVGEFELTSATMNPADIKATLDAAVVEGNNADRRAATCALLALATMAREISPAAAYVLLAETDQNDSGELWVQGVWNAEHEEISDSEPFDGDPIAYHLHGGNEYLWKPLVTAMTEPGKSHLGEYLLNITEVLSEVPLWSLDDEPTSGSLRSPKEKK
jgi:hypothetical protein